MRERIRKQNERYKERKQAESSELLNQQENLLKRQLERENTDRTLIRRATEICRLLESLKVVIHSDEIREIQQGTETNNYVGSTFCEKGILVLEKLIKVGLEERFQLVIDGLDAHRAIISRPTDDDFRVSASEGPYLKALSDVLKYADYVIEQLVFGDYKIESRSHWKTTSNDLEQVPIKAVSNLATGNILLEVEKMASKNAIYILDALFEDRNINGWLETVENYLSTTNTISRLDITDEISSEHNISILDDTLNELMYALSYCGSFTSFLSSLGALGADASTKPGSIFAKQLDLSSAYIRLEEAWMSSSLVKATKLANVTDEGHGCVVGIVDDMWFVIHEKAFARAVATRSGLTCSAIANHIFRLLDDGYSRFIISLLDSKSKFTFFVEEDVNFNGTGEKGSSLGGGTVNNKNSTSYHGDSEELFSVLLDNDVQGISKLSSSLLISINTVERSSERLNALALAIQSQFQHAYPETLFQVEMAIQGLFTVGTKHDSVRHKAIKEVCVFILWFVVLSDFFQSRWLKTVLSLVSRVLSMI